MLSRIMGLSLIATFMRDIGTGRAYRKAPPPSIEEINREFHKDVLAHLVDIAQRLGKRKYSISTITVLYTIHLHGPIEVEEIALKTKLDMTVVRSCVNTLRRDEMIRNSSNVSPALYRTTALGISTLNRGML